eukprot:scaffold231771_cov31-Tisochrysis_lutea.AAC.8
MLSQQAAHTLLRRLRRQLVVGIDYGNSVSKKRALRLSQQSTSSARAFGVIFFTCISRQSTVLRAACTQCGPEATGEKAGCVTGRGRQRAARGERERERNEGSGAHSAMTPMALSSII